MRKRTKSLNFVQLIYACPERFIYKREKSSKYIDIILTQTHNYKNIYDISYFPPLFNSRYHAQRPLCADALEPGHSVVLSCALLSFICILFLKGTRTPTLAGSSTLFQDPSHITLR